MSTIAYRLHDGLNDDEYYFSEPTAKERMKENPDFEITKIKID